MLGKHRMSVHGGRQGESKIRSVYRVAGLAGRPRRVFRAGLRGEHAGGGGEQDVLADGGV